MTVRLLNTTIAAACAALLSLGGCHSSRDSFKFGGDDSVHYRRLATDIEYPTVQECELPLAEVIAPRDLETAAPNQFWDMRLEEAIAIALQNSDVLKDVGGRVLTAPDILPTVFDPAIQEADPQFGPEGALSAFDAELASNLFWRKNDRVFNNPIAGGGAAQQFEYQQDFASLDTELRKRTATGTTFSLRNLTDFDRNTANPDNRLFPESWNSQIDFSVRQPLLQGRGSLFNRIAGPDAQPGFNTTAGVLIGRINTDVSLADFDAAVIEFTATVERAYWDLYFAYRDLDAAVLARDQALETWQTVKAKYENNLRGGEAYLEARARAQYFLFQDQVQDALNGVRTGTTAATARSVGVYAGERRLRWLLGLPTTGPQIIRPTDEPTTAKIAFDWETSVQEALVERVELRRQRWQVKRFELLRLAARNFVLPRLDTFALYRVRGFGGDLAGDSLQDPLDPDADIMQNQIRFASAYSDLGTFDHQEWEAGLQLEMPLGFRQGWAGVRQSELQLARSRAVLAEQEKLVTLELSNAFAETTRAYAAVRANADRLAAAQQDRLATKSAYDADQVTVDILLDSQQRLAEAQRLYFASLTNYALSLMELHIRKGTLLAYDGIYLSEGPWARKAYRDAAEVGRRWRPRRLSHAQMTPPPVSAGHFEAELQSSGPEPGGAPIVAPPATDSELLQPQGLIPSAPSVPAEVIAPEPIGTTETAPPANPPAASSGT